MYHFVSENAAAQQGWTRVSEFKADSVTYHGKKYYVAQAERKLSCMRRFCQALFVSFICFITLGIVLSSKRVRQWKKEVGTCKMIRQIFCQTYPSQLVATNVLKSQTDPLEIVHDKWRAITVKVNDKSQTYVRDALIAPLKEDPTYQAAMPWDWKWDPKDPMEHKPGIRIKDLDHYLSYEENARPDVVILSQGRGMGGELDNPGPGILELEAGVVDYLKEKGIPEVYVEKTAKAIDLYKEIQRTDSKKRIAAFIHTTC